MDIAFYIRHIQGITGSGEVSRSKVGNNIGEGKMVLFQYTHALRRLECPLAQNACPC
jgi:hypothetical protein